MLKRLMVLALFVATSALADDHPEMKKLDWLVGEWKGEATMTMQGGKVEQALQTERVQPKVGGKILMVEGEGRTRLENGTAGPVVHDAFGVISWDAEKKQYRFVAHVAGKPSLDTALEPVDGAWRWGFPVPQGKIRYTIRQTEKGDWNETGEFSRDGERWTKFFEMNLKKTSK